MGVKINGERIKQALLKKESSGCKVTLYLQKSVYQDFKAHCEPLSASEVVTELMKIYMATSKGKHQAKYKKSR